MPTTSREVTQRLGNTTEMMSWRYLKRHSVSVVADDAAIANDEMIPLFSFIVTNHSNHSRYHTRALQEYYGASNSVLVVAIGKGFTPCPSAFQL